MKKILILSLGVFFLGITSLLRAQCYGVVHYDQSATAAGLRTFNITTANPNELILIAYNGWFGPGAGPVTVDGNPATHINTAHTSNDACAEVYCYFAPAAGVHNIVCTETGYNLFNPPNYILNFASAFYVTGTPTLLSCASLVTTVVANPSGNTVNNSITATVPGEMIFGSFVYNTGIFNPYAIVVTGATVTETLHEGDGIDASEAYEPACTAGVYNVNTSDVNSCCGGGTVLVAIVPGSGPCGGGLTVIPTTVLPTCGNCNGSISLAVSGGNAPYTYTWTPNVSTTNSATGLCPGTYSITVKDISCPPKDTTLVIVLPANNMTITGNITANEPCNGNCVGSANTTLVGGTAPFTYAWAPSGGNASSASNLCAGTYTVTVHDINGCSGTTSLTITQPAVLTATASGPNVLCNGGTSTLTGTAAGGTTPYGYMWTPGGNTNAITTGMSAGTYTTTVTDANGCTASASTTITQPAALTINVTGPAVICAGGSGTLTANTAGGTSPYAYAWSPGITSTTSTATITPLVSQNYSVTVTDANGCTASAQITINLGPPITLALSGNTVICNSMQTTLCVTASGGTGGNIYQWLPGNQTSPCITVSPTSTTTYTISVSDNCGTTATATTTVRVNPLPAIQFSADIYQGCAPLCVQFRNATTLSQGSAFAYAWTFGNGDSSHAQNPIYCYPSNGTYNVGLTVTSDSGCSSTLNRVNMITTYSRPATSFTFSPQSANILAPTIQFTDNSADKYSIVYWTWNFGDGSNTTSNLQNPSHTYQDTGRYCASLITMDAHGCTDTATNCLVIDPTFNLYIPSAFTPNGDGKNDVFQARGQYIKSFEMYIFDRWGMQVFHSNDINNGWSGKVNGGSNLAQEDTYEYKIMVTDSKNKQHSYIGKVNLIK